VVNLLVEMLTDTSRLLLYFFLQLPLGLSLHATESSCATCDWLPQANGRTVTYFQYIGHFYYKVEIVGVLCASSHQLGAYSKIFRMHKALNPLPSTGAFLCLMLRHLLELGKVATAGSLPIHLEILQKLKT